MRLRNLWAGAFLLLAGCGGDVVRYEVPVTASETTASVAASSVEVRDVSLPLYAGLEPISVEGPDGAIRSDPDLLWADDPVRAVTGGLARALAALGPGVIAAEPWPFFEDPARRLDVRFDRMVAGRDGLFRMSGQYFVSAPGEDRPPVSGRFELVEPYIAGSVTSIAAAKGALIGDLAAQIAAEAL